MSVLKMLLVDSIVSSRSWRCNKIAAA